MTTRPQIPEPQTPYHLTPPEKNVRGGFLLLLTENDLMKTFEFLSGANLCRTVDVIAVALAAEK